MALFVAYLVFGLLMLTSATGPVAYQKFNDSYWYLKHQVLFGLLPGAVLFFIFYVIDYRYWRRFGTPALVASLVLLLTVFIPGLGANWGSSKSWLHIGSYSLQPIEIAKLLLLVFMAAHFEKWRHESPDKGVAGGVWPFLAAIGAAAILLMLQPDLGGMLMILAMAFIAYFAAGAPWQHLAGLGAAGLVGGFALMKAAPYRAARFMTFLHPEMDPRGIGYHINQAYLAIGSGGLFGLGLGHSRQKYLYLPEVSGDSVFAVIAEELGFVVTLAFLMLIAAFLMRGLRIAQRAPDDFGRVLAAGIVGWIFVQVMFNVCSMVGLMPITGLPLPFVSYGGTAYMALMAGVGLLANISKHSAA